MGSLGVTELVIYGAVVVVPASTARVVFPVVDSWLVSAWSVVNAVGLLYVLAALVVWCGLISPWRRRQRLVEATR